MNHPLLISEQSICSCIDGTKYMQIETIDSCVVGPAIKELINNVCHD